MGPEEKEIPSYTRYVIDTNGNARVKETDKVVTWHNSNGYKFAVLVDDLGNRRSVGQHRALALAFLPQPNTSDKITVNHKDGNRSNNALSNLEWSTYGENITHAYKNGLRTDRIPVILTDTRTNETIRFYSKSECAKWLGISRVDLTVKCPTKISRYGPYRLEFLTEESTWTNVTEYPSGVAARCIRSGVVVVADTPAQLGKLTNVCPKLIKRIIRNVRFQYPTKGFDFRSFGPDLKWPSYTEEEVNAFAMEEFIYCPLRITGRDYNDVLVGSVKQASLITGTHERSIRSHLKDGTICTNGFTYSRYVRQIVYNV